MAWRFLRGEERMEPFGQRRNRNALLLNMSVSPWWILKQKPKFTRSEPLHSEVVLALSGLGKNIHQVGSAQANCRLQILAHRTHEWVRAAL